MANGGGLRILAQVSALLSGRYFAEVTDSGFPARHVYGVSHVERAGCGVDER